MSEKKPIVARETSARNICPVCSKPSYSATGTHPQCSVARADALSRADRKAAEIELSKAPRKSWSKACPKCKHEIPARKIICDCGHKFSTMPTGMPGGTPKPSAFQQPTNSVKKPR